MHQQLVRLSTLGAPAQLIQDGQGRHARRIPVSFTRQRTLNSTTATVVKPRPTSVTTSPSRTPKIKLKEPPPTAESGRMTALRLAGDVTVGVLEGFLWALGAYTGAVWSSQPSLRGLNILMIIVLAVILALARQLQQRRTASV